MRSSETSSSIPFRSKKPRLSKSASKSQSSNSVHQLSTKTPEKPPQISHRLRNRGVALSVKDVRKVAESLQKPNREQNHEQTAPVKSARRQIMMSPSKPKIAVDKPTKLPEKYENLAEFFDSLDSSIRLLRLKGSISTFTNIFPKIQCLTDRRFTHGHLAQLKFILPEAIVTKKVLSFDERTSCMKPDLHITINHDTIESDAKLPTDCAKMSLRKLFRTRLRDFINSHPEGAEVPEEELPEPFNNPNKIPPTSFTTKVPSNANVAHSPAVLAACIQDGEFANKTEPASVNLDQNLMSGINREEKSPVPSKQPAVATHISQSFRRRFSQRSTKNEAENVQDKLPSDALQHQAFQDSDPSLKKNSPYVRTTFPANTCTAKLASETASNEGCPTVCASPSCPTSSNGPAVTPSKTIECTEDEHKAPQNTAAMSTPAKAALTPSRLMTATPALPPPKRSLMSPDDNASCSPNKLVRRPPRSRSLIFDTPVKNEGTGDEFGNDDKDILNILSEDLLQSIREKERIAMEERNPAISQAKRRQKMIATLPKLFNMIHLLFHAINRSVITKEELVSKIISSHCDIVDRSEVEEQLNLLLELVPEWITEKMASSGDLLFCVNKMVDAKAIRSQLQEAK